MLHFKSARSYIYLSIGAAIITIGMKFGAYMITGSVGLLSDAIEGLVNLFAALFAFWALTIAERPPDEEHAYGHSKVEYFASGLEGALILVAAASIAWTAIQRLRDPQPLESLGIGLLIAAAAAAINGVMALILIRAGKTMRSPALNADGHHLLTDVWTTGGVIIGLLLVQITGAQWLDPVIALIVAANIVWTAVKLLRSTGLGLIDSALPAEDQQAISAILEKYRRRGIAFHALRTRMAGARRFMSIHILVPGMWTVTRAHTLADELETEIRTALPGATVFTHIEPLEDPISWDDQGLDGAPRAAVGGSAVVAAKGNERQAG